MYSTDIYGSGSFVSCLGKFYLLTCCHNFLMKEDGDKLTLLGKEDGDKVSTLEDGDMEGKMKRRCKRAKYLCSTRDFKGTVALPAKIVLTNPDDPVLIFDKVSDNWLSQLCKPKCGSQGQKWKNWLSEGKEIFVAHKLAVYVPSTRAKFASTN